MTVVPKIRVLVVDDSVVVRRIVTDALAEEPEFEVVGTAANGRIALAKLTQCNPDVVTLDIEMPEMDGLACVTEIRKTHPKLPVVMFSTLTERGAAATLDALGRGATDYVTKPSNNAGGATEAKKRIREELVPKLRSLARPAVAPVPAAAAPRMVPAARAVRPAGGRRVDVVVIGVSTGGPNALAELMPEIPGSLPVPVVIVQHMPPLFTRLLADRLNSRCQLTVREAFDGALLEPGQAWIAPGDWHVEIARDGTNHVLRTHQGPPENSCRPAVDVLFRSAAQTFGDRCLSVVLTGMGQDGLRGCEGIAARGGQVVVQDEASSVVWGMPGFVARAGLAERVLPLREIATEIVQRVSAGRSRVERPLAAEGARR